MGPYNWGGLKGSDGEVWYVDKDRDLNILITFKVGKVSVVQFLTYNVSYKE